MQLAARHIEASNGLRPGGRGAFGRDRRTVGGLSCTYAKRLSFSRADPADPSAFYVLVQLSGRAGWRRPDGDVVLAAGQAGLIDGAAPPVLDADEASACLCLEIPRELLDRQVDGGGATPVKGAGAALLSAFLRTAFDNAGALGAEHDRAVRETLVRLVLANWGVDGLVSERENGEPALIRQVKAYLLRHLDDPCLSPHAIAKVHRVSVRHLHRLFRATGASLGDWVRQSRLARCAADLRDGARQGDSLTEIAFRWGFSDSAHFSRTFRAQYGQSPRAYRAGRPMLEAPARESPCF
ncbi:MAG: helix-turn-helix domain-containing protein [Caulobacteraceae bacterium]